jgi:integrase
VSRGRGEPAAAAATEGDWTMATESGGAATRKGGPAGRAGRAPGPVVLDGLGPAAAAYARAAFAPNTRRAYRADLLHFDAWCRAAGRTPMPVEPTTVADYLAALAGTHRPSTLRRRLAAISRASALAGGDVRPLREVARTVMAGIAAVHGAPPRQAAALGTAEIRRLVASCDASLQGLRDRALLLVCYAGALRRSELVAIRTDDLRSTAEGIEVTIPRSKGDRAGTGQRVGIPRGARADTCPVRALARWLEAAPAAPGGAVFRKVRVVCGRGARRHIVLRESVEADALHPDSVRFVLARRAAAAGLVGTLQEPVSPHGLRAGFVTQAYKAGASDEAIMAHTRHRDLRTMRGYVRRARLVSDSPAKRLGL